MSSRITRWRKENPDKYEKQIKRYLRLNRKKINNYYKAYPYKCLESWVGFLPETTSCRCCGLQIYFNKRDRMTSIHFDHRHGGTEAIKTDPSAWLRSHKRNKKNEDVWNSCDFGYLCNKCNKILPTRDRKMFLDRITKYILESEGVLSFTS
jgi:hypothetical protein